MTKYKQLGKKSTCTQQFLENTIEQIKIHELGKTDNIQKKQKQNQENEYLTCIKYLKIHELERINIENAIQSAKKNTYQANILEKCTKNRQYKNMIKNMGFQIHNYKMVFKMWYYLRCSFMQVGNPVSHLREEAIKCPFFVFFFFL